MKLTPLDIQHMTFRQTWRGFDRQEVERFLHEVAQTVEALNYDNVALREKLTATEEQLAELKRAESGLSQTLVLAQAMTEDVKEAARRDADLVVKEAELKAAELLRDVQEELGTLQREILDLRKQRLLGLERVRSTLRVFERVLELEEAEQEIRSSAPRS